ncbi:hypothetical protein DRJ04_05770, partial [Candidatus Aerophobetes bacterium]
SCKISFQKLAYAPGFLPKDLILIGIFPSQKTVNKKFQETGEHDLTKKFYTILYIPYGVGYNINKNDEMFKV